MRRYYRPRPRDAFPKLRLSAVYGLTEAEARLAGLLANGKKLRAATATLGITYARCRTRLTGIFEKTETWSQHELVALLIKTLALWRVTPSLVRNAITLPVTSPLNVRPPRARSKLAFARDIATFFKKKPYTPSNVFLLSRIVHSVVTYGR